MKKKMWDLVILLAIGIFGYFLFSTLTKPAEEGGISFPQIFGLGGQPVIPSIQFPALQYPSIQFPSLTYPIRETIEKLGETIKEPVEKAKDTLQGMAIGTGIEALTGIPSGAINILDALKNTLGALPGESITDALMRLTQGREAGIPGDIGADLEARSMGLMQGLLGLFRGPGLAIREEVYGQARIGASPVESFFATAFDVVQEAGKITGIGPAVKNIMVERALAEQRVPAGGGGGYVAPKRAPTHLITAAQGLTGVYGGTTPETAVMQRSPFTAIGRKYFERGTWP